MANRIRVGVGDIVRVVGKDTRRVVIDIEWTDSDDCICRTVSEHASISKRAVVKDYLESELHIVSSSLRKTKT